MVPCTKHSQFVRIVSHFNDRCGTFLARFSFYGHLIGNAPRIPAVKVRVKQWFIQTMWALWADKKHIAVVVCRNETSEAGLKLKILYRLHCLVNRRCSCVVPVTSATVR